MKHLTFLGRNFPVKKGLKMLNSLHTRTSIHTCVHTPRNFYKVIGGGVGWGDIAPTINIKYKYNDESSTGKSKQNA